MRRGRTHDNTIAGNEASFGLSGVWHDLDQLADGARGTRSHYIEGDVVGTFGTPRLPGRQRVLRLLGLEGDPLHFGDLVPAAHSQSRQVIRVA